MRYVAVFAIVALSAAALWAGDWLAVPGLAADPEPPCRWPCDFATAPTRLSEEEKPDVLPAWQQLEEELARLGPAINSGTIPIQNGECVTAMDGESLELWLACGPDADAMLTVAPLDGSTRIDDSPRSEITLPPHVLEALTQLVDRMIAGDVGAEQTAVFLYDADSGKVATWVGTKADAFLASSRAQLAPDE